MPTEEELRSVTVQLLDDHDYPWLQQLDEPALWYGRFRTFLRLGHKRKMTDVYRIENRLPETRRVVNLSNDWHLNAHIWRWRERAIAYDEYKENRLNEIEIQEAAAARALRRGILSIAGTKFEEAIRYMPPVKDWKEASDFIKSWTTALRDEYGDNPTMKVETNATITYKVIEEITNVFVSAFLEVNDIVDSDQRRQAMADKMKVLQAHIEAA